jgi:RimJ/RimL family protein N-acetyltransferase
MTEAIRAVLAFGFDTLELNRVRATVVTSNIASAKFLEHLSFEKEGLLRQAQFVNGKFDDLIAFALLRQQWAA